MPLLLVHNSLNHLAILSCDLTSQECCHLSHSTVNRPLVFPRVRREFDTLDLIVQPRQVKLSGPSLTPSTLCTEHSRHKMSPAPLRSIAVLLLLLLLSITNVAWRLVPVRFGVLARYWG